MDAAFGRPRMVPSRPVTEHLRNLRASGVIVSAIAERAGVSSSLIDELLNRPRELIRSDNASALLATKPEPAPFGYVAGIGTIRRIRALGAIGWSMRDICQASSGAVSIESLRDINSVERPFVLTRTHVAVAAVYEELCMRTPPSGRTASQVRVKAAMKGWLPPLAWDDIDDPAEQPCADHAPQPRGRPERMTSVLEDFDWLASQGISAHEAAARVGVALATIDDYRRRVAKGAAA
jgi:hypothetical protein